MKRSTGRILTTHCCSLARPTDLLEMTRAKPARTRRPRRSPVPKIEAAVGTVLVTSAPWNEALPRRARS